MKIRVATFAVIDKRHPEQCGRTCPGLYFDLDEGYNCTIFGWKDLKRVDEGDLETNPLRCRACRQNQIRPTGGVR